jgi:hypothetical protein
MPLMSLRTYSLTMIIIQISLGMVWATGIFPVQMSIAGVSISDFSSGLASDCTYIVQNVANGGALDYFTALGMFMWMVAKIVCSFLLLVFAGFASIFAALNFPLALYAPIQTIVDAVVIFDFAQSRWG